MTRKNLILETFTPSNQILTCEEQFVCSIWIFIFNTDPSTILQCGEGDNTVLGA